jgi:hypothetical protein
MRNVLKIVHLANSVDFNWINVLKMGKVLPPLFIEKHKNGEYE